MEKTQQASLLQIVSTGLLSIITAAIIGVFCFLWNLNRDFGNMQERDRTRSEEITTIKNDVKDMKTDVGNLKGQVGAIQAIQDVQKQVK